MSTVITFASEKGGVTKTSTCNNLAVCLAQSGYSVLLVDLDPQANTTYMFTGHKKKDDVYKGRGIYDMFRAYGIRNPGDYITDSYIHENIKLLPSNAALPLAIGQLQTLEQENGISRNQFLLRCLAEIPQEFDFILCDTNPSRDTLLFNALVASDYVVIPCVCDEFSLDGLETTYALMRKIQKEEDVEIELLGIVLNVVEKYTLTNFARQQIKESDYGDSLFESEIRKGQVAKDSLTLGKPAVITAPKSGVAKDYQALTEEILKKIKK